MSTLYTPEQRLDAFDRAADVMKLIRENKRPDRVLAGLKAIVSDDDIAVIPKVMVTPTGKVYHITSDPSVRTTAGLITGLDCPVKLGLAENPFKIPMIIQPCDCRARLVPLGQVRTTEEIYNIPLILGPNELFNFGRKFPEDQLQDPIVTVWLDSNGQCFCAILHRYLGERFVSVDRSHPDDGWVDCCCVLIREL